MDSIEEEKKTSYSADKYPVDSLPEDKLKHIMTYYRHRFVNCKLCRSTMRVDHRSRHGADRHNGACEFEYVLVDPDTHIQFTESHKRIVPHATRKRSKPEPSGIRVVSLAPTAIRTMNAAELASHLPDPEPGVMADSVPMPIPERRPEEVHQKECEPSSNSNKMAEAGGCPGILTFNDDHRVDNGGHKKRVGRPKGRIRCNCCGEPLLKKNLIRHIQSSPLCKDLYLDEDGAPREVLLSIGIGRRWRHREKYKKEYVLVKRDILVQLEDACAYLYNKVTDYERKELTNDGSLDEVAALCAGDHEAAFKHAKAIFECFNDIMSIPDDHSGKRLTELYMLQHTLKGLELVFKDIYKVTKDIAGRCCVDLKCNTTLPQCTGVMLRIEHEKERMIKEAYDKETSVLKEMGLTRDGHESTDIFTQKLEELQKFVELEQNEPPQISRTSESEILSMESKIRGLEEGIKRLEAVSDDISSKLTKARFELNIWQEKLHQLKAEVAGELRSFTRLQQGLLHLNRDRIKVLQSVIKRRRKKLHEHLVPKTAA